MNLPLSPNGAAYTTRETRDGVPLSYISEKLAYAIEDTHAAAQAHPEMRLRLSHVMYSQTLAFLALHNMLGAADDSGLPERLLDLDRRELRKWINAVVTYGDLLGVGGIGTRSNPG
ncbi:hypothetical protein SAMN05446635_1015 [Burkholderia sp. OK233]|nr:hypothetical protein SAMN05446635_1015 [Burkholderia sp. OK233]